MGARATRRESVCFWLRREGISADVGRPLRFDTPVIGRPHGFREPHGADRVGGAEWARRTASELAGALWVRRNDPGCRGYVRHGLGLVRRGWLAHCAGRSDLARAMYAMAVSEWLRTGMTLLGAKAGDAWVAEQTRQFAGRAAHGSGPARTRDAVMRAHLANTSASNYKIAQLTGIPEPTVRRHRPKGKTPPNRAP